MAIPTFTIRDEADKALVKVDLAGAGLGRYVRSAISLRSLAGAPKLLASPLGDHSGTRTLALALDTDVPVGRSVELSINAGASAGIGIHPSGSTLFDDGDLQASPVVPNGTTLASLTLEAVLGVRVGVPAGGISFGFEAGTSIRYGYYHPFDTVAESPTVKAAVERLVGAAVLPADVDDLRALQPGALVTLAGEGEISFSGEATLSATTNLLATPGLPIVGSIALKQAGSVSVRAEWRLRGGFELRLEKAAASTIQLSYFRRRGREFSVSAHAVAGVSVPFRDRDLLTTLMMAISPDPEADVIALVDAGLDDDSIEAIQAAVAASIDRSLTISAQLDLSSERQDDALFSYAVDLSRLDAAGEAALADALHGRLGPLDRMAAAPGGPVRLVRSAAATLKARKSAWRVNLLGILNVARFVDLVQRGHVMFDRVSGALTAADEISAKRVRIVSAPLESDARKLREVLFESLMVTTAYQASRTLGPSLTLTAEQSYLEQRNPTHAEDLAEHYRVLVALSLCAAQERDRRLASPELAELGASTFFVHNQFDPSACDALFLAADGTPWPAEHYEAIGRRALLALLVADDPVRGFRRLALETDEVWSRVRLLGDDLRHALPSSIRQDPRKLNLVNGDVLTILWWAKAMSRAARALLAMRAFIGGRTSDELDADPGFARERQRLADDLMKVVATTAARFDLPWDVLAMDEAARRLGRLDAAIVAPGFAVRYAEAEQPQLLPALVRAETRAAAATLGPTPHQWTPSQLDVFSRHVVNLRNGQLSAGGGFGSTPDQVRRLFREHIPAYVEERRRRGLRPRVLFFAHGGLIEETDGLRGVLARQSVWALNGVYPVYFVWETGLLETLQDIVGGATGRAQTVGAITDAVIEAAARPGGKPVWSQMKKSAERAAAAGGGSRLVAQLAAELSASVDGEVEFHALGHSAGAIFHAHFLPALVKGASGGQAVTVRTLHLLAPAITTTLFKKALQPLIGSGQPITSLATYTMVDDLERQDHTVRPYGKSLLYLVSGSFEDAVPTPLLGLQRSLRQDVPLIRFFGLAGTEKVADLVLSKTDAGSPLTARSESVTHGGFDNDVATMTSVIRRILDVADADAVVDYFEDEVPGFEKKVSTPELAAAGPPEKASARRSRAPKRPRKAPAKPVRASGRRPPARRSKPAARARAKKRTSRR